MKKYQLAELTSILETRLFGNENVTPSWKVAIYYALNLSAGNNLVIQWTKHKQWNIDHQYRGQKSVLKNKDNVVTEVEIKKINNDSIKIIYKIYGEQACINLERQHFDSVLWRKKVKGYNSLLVNKTERDWIFDEFLLQSNVIKTTSRSEKYEALSKLLMPIRRVYRKLNIDIQKRYIETVIGAAIFYLPQSRQNFSGFASIGAIKQYLTKGNLVKDHIIPRRKSAMEILKSNMDAKEVERQYEKHFSKYMFVSSKENHALKNYFQNHNTYDEALKANKIIKFPVKFQSENDFRKFLDHLQSKLKTPGDSIDKIDLDLLKKLYMSHKNQLNF